MVGRANERRRFGCRGLFSAPFRIRRSQDDVAPELSAIVTRRAKPEMIAFDRGTEFVCNAMRAWSNDTVINWHFIVPGKPMQNGFIESYNGRLRDERSTKVGSSIWITPAPRSPTGRRFQCPAASVVAEIVAPRGLCRPPPATDGRLRKTDQLHPSSVAPPAALGVQHPKTL